MITKRIKRLTPIIIEEIMSGSTIEKIALKYEVSQTTVVNVLRTSGYAKVWVKLPAEAVPFIPFTDSRESFTIVKGN
jgi:hypothetical protein